MTSKALLENSFCKLALKPESFVDKTLLIKEWIESQESSVLITRPRRWGKTMNLDMLEYFFSIPVDEEGKLIESELQAKREFFSKLKIGKYPNILDDHLGKYPVIYFSFFQLDYTHFERFKKAFSVHRLAKTPFKALLTGLLSEIFSCRS